MIGKIPTWWENSVHGNRKTAGKNSAMVGNFLQWEKKVFRCMDHLVLRHPSYMRGFTFPVSLSAWVCLLIFILLIDLVSGPVLYVRRRILLGGPADGNDEVQLTLALLHTVKNTFKTSIKKWTEKTCQRCFMEQMRNSKAAFLRPRFELFIFYFFLGFCGFFKFFI